MATYRNERAYCFICQTYVPRESAEPLLLGQNNDVVKWACKSHELGEQLVGNLTEREEVAIVHTQIAPPKKRGTIVVIVEGGLVQDVHTDIEGPDAPLVYVLDYDVEGNTDSEYLVEIDSPLSSLGDNGPVKREQALCTEWPLDASIDAGSVRRLEEAVARTHYEKQDDGITPLHDERDLADDEEPAGSRRYRCHHCGGLYTGMELMPLAFSKVPTKPPFPAGGCPECAEPCYEETPGSNPDDDFDANFDPKELSSPDQGTGEGYSDFEFLPPAPRK